MLLKFGPRCAALMLAVLAAASCEPENDNSVSCAAEDCASSCVSLGFPGGACTDDVCTCDMSDTDPFEWDGGGDTDTDTDMDTDTDTDMDTDTDTDTDDVPDSGAKLG